MVVSAGTSFLHGRPHFLRLFLQLTDIFILPTDEILYYGIMSKASISIGLHKGHLIKVSNKTDLGTVRM